MIVYFLFETDVSSYLCHYRKEGVNMMRSYVLGVASAFAVAASFCAYAEDYVVTVAENDPDVVWSDVSEDGSAGLLADGVKDRRLVKMGKGRLIIACDLNSAEYAGEIRASEGYLRLRNNGACGTPLGVLS